MRAVFNVFSGTGNTHKVCHAVMEEWRRAGVECKYVNIGKDCEVRDPNKFERMVIGYPVHAFNAPQPVFDFIKRLPESSGDCLVYLVKTSGEPLRLNDGSCAHVYDLLKKKGYKVGGEYHYVMPYNMIFRHSDGMAARMWQAAERRIPHDAASMLSGVITPLKKGPFKRLVSGIFRIEHPAMPIIGRLFKATDACIGCGKCARTCPQKNITMAGGRPVFGNHCVGCVGCSFGCPVKAIKIGVLNGWRVNGSYNFSGKPATDDEVCRYCRRSYIRYFHEAEKYPLTEEFNGNGSSAQLSAMAAAQSADVSSVDAVTEAAAADAAEKDAAGHEALDGAD